MAAGGGDDDGATATATTTTPGGPLEVALHATARALQLQHGLRHGNYQRYRRYCTRRLRRLRLAGGLTHGHGSGGSGKGGSHRSGQPQTFQLKPLLPTTTQTQTQTQTPPTPPPEADEAGEGEDEQAIAAAAAASGAITQEHLLLALLGAERAWALAMQLKQDHAGGRGMPSHVRSHAVRRLRKAAWWAALLQALCSASANADGSGSGGVVVSERTALEAEAYAQGMAALLALEQERWEAALGGLRVAHSILARFAEMPGASLHDQDLFALKADEALQSMRYCQFQLGSEQQLLHDPAALSHLPPGLRGKLEAALAGARKEAASSLASVEWGHGGGRVALPTEATRVAVLKLREAEEAAAVASQGDDEEAEAAFGAVFGAYGEALACVQGELAALEREAGAGPRAEAQRQELRALGVYLQHGRLQTTMGRTKALIARLRAQPPVAGQQERERAAEVAHLYETLAQGAGEAVRVLMEGGVEAPEDVATVAQAEEACCRARRALSLADFHAAAASAGSSKGGQQQEQAAAVGLARALALYERAGVVAEEAAGLVEDVDRRAAPDTREALAAEAAALQSEAKGGRVRAQALALLASLGSGIGSSEEEALASAMAALALAAKDGGKPATTAKGGKGKTTKKGSSSHRTLLERLGDLDGGREADGFGLARVPPTGLAPIRAKPPLFDMAFNYFADARLPDLAAKAGMASSSSSRKQQGPGGGGGGLFGWLRG